MRTLQEIADTYPNLIFQNDGYEYINKSLLTAEELQAIEEVTSILKSKIKYFTKFFNFKKRKSGELDVRFDGYYDMAGFQGVYYINIKEVDEAKPWREEAADAT